MSDTDKPAKRSRFDQTEPEPRKASRFDRRSRSPPTRRPEPRDRSPLPEAQETSEPRDPTAGAAAAAGAYTKPQPFPAKNIHLG